MVTRKLHLVGCTAAKEAFLVSLRVQRSKQVENSSHDVLTGVCMLLPLGRPHPRGPNGLPNGQATPSLISHMQAPAASSFLLASFLYADHRPAPMRHLMPHGVPNVDLSADRHGPGSTVE